MTLTPNPSLEDIVADLARRVAILEAAAQIPVPGTGTSGTMTPPPLSPVGWVTPKDDFANIRNGSSLKAELLGPLYRGQWRQVVDKRESTDGDGRLWYRIDDGYVRSDVVTFSVDKPVPPVSHNTGALYPAPITGYIITNRHLINGHTGVDLATQTAQPSVLAGPYGGVVAKASPCPTCPPGGSRGVRNASTNQGYGNFVIVRYAAVDLPDAARAPMGQLTYLYVIHAHLSAIHVETGQVLAASQAIGTVGTTGDSTGNHLHLQCRFTADPKADFYSIRANEIDPALVFKL